jgi:ribosome-associated toxin RatA of RatAB toxin-antitoxin module
MADRTESSIDIAAPPADVLRVIADFEAYPEWTGAVKEATVLSKGPGGRAAQVAFVLDAGAIKDSYRLDYTWTVTKSGTGNVAWTLVEPGTLLKALDGSYTLVAKAGGTAVTYQLSVDVKIPMLGMLKRKAEKSIIDTALTELKKQVES